MPKVADVAALTSDDALTFASLSARRPISRTRPVQDPEQVLTLVLLQINGILFRTIEFMSILEKMAHVSPICPVPLSLLRGGCRIGQLSGRVVPTNDQSKVAQAPAHVRA